MHFTLTRAKELAELRINDSLLSKFHYRINESQFIQLFVWFQHALWLYHCEHLQIQNTLHCQHNTPIFKFIWSTLQCVLNTWLCSTNYNNSMVSGIARGGWSSIIHYVVLFSKKTSCAHSKNKLVVLTTLRLPWLQTSWWDSGCILLIA